MRKRKGLVLLAVTMSAAALPAAADSVPLVTWQCWYQVAGPAVACRLLQAPDVGAPAESATATVAHRIRSQPASLGSEVLLIPLYSPTEDMARAARLARAVMCGTQAACTVDFIRAPTN